MARRRRSSRRSRSMNMGVAHMGAMHMGAMHMGRLGVLGSEPMSWGSLAVGALAGFALAKLMARASQSSGTAIQGLGAKKKGPSLYCLKYPTVSWCASMYGK